MFALKTVFHPAAARDAVYSVRVGGETFTVTIAGMRIDLVRGAEPGADVTFDTDSATLRSFAFGRSSLRDAEAAGLRVSGDRRLATRFGRLFRP